MTHNLEHTRSVQDILSERSRQRSEGRYVPENLDWIGRNILPTGDIKYRVEQRELDAPIPGWVPMGKDPYARDLGKILPLGVGGRNRPTSTFPGEYRESNIQIGRLTGRRETGPFTDVAEPGQVEIHEFLHDAERVLRDNPAYWSDVTWLNPDTGKRENLQQLLIHGLGQKRPHTDLSWRRPTFHDAVYWSTDWEGNIKEGSADRAEAILRSLDVAASNIKNAWESGALDQTNYGASRISGMEVSAAQAEMPIDPLAQPYKPGFWAVDYDPAQARWQETESELGGYGVDVRAPPEKIGGTGYQQGLIPSDEPGMADFRGFAGPTDYQQWDVGADYVPGVSAVMPDIRSRDLYTPPGPPGEAAFRQSQAVPSTLQAGNGLISQPVTTGLIEQPDTGVILEQSTYDYDRAQREAEVQDAIRREQIKAPQPQVASMPGESIGVMPPQGYEIMPQGYGESIGLLPPQGYGESIGVLPPRGYGESIGSLNSIDYPQAVARLGLNYATEPVQLPSTTFSNFRATGPEPLYGRGGLPPSVFPQIEVDRGTEGLTIPGERPEIKTRPEIPETGWDEWIKERVEKELERSLDNGGFLSKAGGILGKGLVSMISTVEAATAIEDKLYDALSSAEFRGTTPDFIRTKEKATPGGSTAYGPVQITRTLLSDKKGKLNLTAKEDDYVDRFLEQGKKFAEFGNEPNKSGYDTKYDYGGVGDLTSQKDQKLYKSVAKKLIKLLWDEKGQDMEKFIGRWRGVPRKQDVGYYKAFDKAI